MEQADFERLLANYRVIRSRDAYVPGRPKRHQPLSSGHTAAMTDDAPAPQAKKLRLETPRAKDFWSALPAFLEKHYSKEDAAAISAAIDRIHYSSLKSMNYEDIDDLAGMILRETEAEAR
jgi:hypothetical protein